jgi:DNA-binding MarR family transcriptional regulator
VPEPDPGASTPTLLRTAYNIISAAIYRGVTQAGATDLRPAHGNAMEMLAIEDGLRLKDMAARAGIASQSMGELVDDLVAKGYLQRREDPADRRAKRIYLTGQGHATAAASKVAARNIEEELRRTLGARRYQDMRRALAAIAGMTPYTAASPGRAPPAQQHDTMRSRSSRTQRHCRPAA